MIRPASPEVAILLRRRGVASATEIGTACRMKPGDVRDRLCHVASRSDVRLVPPARVFLITSDVRRTIEQRSSQP